MKYLKNLANGWIQYYVGVHDFLNGMTDTNDRRNIHIDLRGGFKEKKQLLAFWEMGDNEGSQAFHATDTTIRWKLKGKR